MSLPQYPAKNECVKCSSQADDWAAHVISWGVKWRTRLLSLPYGDQCLFVHADVFVYSPLLSSFTNSFSYLSNRPTCNGSFTTKHSVGWIWHVCLRSLLTVGYSFLHLCWKYIWKHEHHRPCLSSQHAHNNLCSAWKSLHYRISVLHTKIEFPYNLTPCLKMSWQSTCNCHSEAILIQKY